MRTPTGFTLAPMRDGKPMAAREFQKLVDDRQVHFSTRLHRLGMEQEYRVLTRRAERLLGEQAALHHQAMSRQP